MSLRQMTEYFRVRRRLVSSEGPELSAHEDVTAYDTERCRDECEDEEGYGGGGGSGGLEVDVGEGEDAGGGQVREVGRGVEDGDQVEETGDEGEDVLHEDRFGDVACGSEGGGGGSVGSVEERRAIRCYSPWHFFCQMGWYVRCSHGESRVQHSYLSSAKAQSTTGKTTLTKTEREGVTRPAGLIRHVLPDKSAGCVGFPFDLGHNRADQDGYQKPEAAHKCPYRLDIRQRCISEEDNQAAKPGAHEIAHENVPILQNVFRVGGGIHLWPSAKSAHTFCRVLARKANQSGRTRLICREIVSTHVPSPSGEP